MPLLRWQQNIVDEAGNVLPSSTVEIRDEVSGALVNLFEDIDGVTPKGNPLTTDADGYGFAYMEPGRFKVTATSADLEFTKSWRDVRLANDFSELDDRINQRVIYVGSLDDLADFDSPGDQSAYLNDGYKSGPFTSTTDDISAEVSADPQRGVHVPFSSDPTGGSGGWVRDDAEYELNLYWFDASGDYDPNTETPGKIAVNATNNFDAFNGARLLLEHRNQGRLVVEGAPGNADFWCRNMPRFQLSNFELYIAKGTRVRMTTPSSFGSTITVGEPDVTENCSVIGGGTVSNYLPNLDTLDLWQASTAYPAETYIKTSANHAYWTELGGTTGTTEPTVIAGSETDGTVVWRDALNENGISIAGDATKVIGMDVPSASNKGITIQSPPWRDAVFRDNIVGSTHHDGIEMKGNQGIAGQEALIGARGLMENNTVLSAGRHGIHAEQPASGTNKNQDIHVIDNTVVNAGVRHSTKDHHGIRVNRCLRPVVRGNKVLNATGNGVFFRQCEDVTGDVFVRNYGIWGMYLDGNDTVSLSSASVVGNGGAVEAVRLNANTGSIWCGNLKVDGTNYTRAFNGLSGSIMRCGEADLTAGASGLIDNDGPIVSSGSIVGSFSSFSETQGSASIPASGRETFLNISGQRTSVISGAIYGAPGVRLEIILDGGSVIQLTGSQSFDGAGNGYVVIPIPPVAAFDSIELKANNNTGSSETVAWNVIYS